MAKKRVAVILSGCGNRDGSEITEAVSTLISLSQWRIDYEVFAPSVEVHEVDHLSGQQRGQTRNSLREAARIARAKAQDIQSLDPAKFDGLAIPGGLGAVTVLSNFAQKGAHGKVLPDVERVLNTFYEQSKPIGAICIAPALLALVLGHHKITITIGNDSKTIEALKPTGIFHEACAVTDFVTDREHKVITAPAYMYDDASPYEVFTGINGAMRELAEMA